MALHRALVLVFGIFGAAITQYLTYRFLPVAEIFRWKNWESPWIAGATAGAIVGHFIWVIGKPRQRASRAAAICVLANVLVWVSFLIFSPPLDDAEFDRVESERRQRDAEAGSGHLDLVTHQPIVVAARWHGTFGAVSFADWLLTLFAGPAIGFAELLIVPSRYIGIYGIHATKRESFAIAGFGFVLSTGFWVASGDVVSALRRSYRRRAARRATNQSDSAASSDRVPG
jgi:hypothetical protein